MYRIASTLPHSSIRGRGPRLLDMRPERHPVRFPYDGPFACTYSGLTVSVSDGRVFAGCAQNAVHYAGGGEWYFPGANANGQTRTIDLTPSSGPCAVVLEITVDAYDGWFTAEVDYPALDFVPLVDVATQDGFESNCVRVILCEVDVGADRINSLQQCQYGHIYVPVASLYGPTVEAYHVATLGVRVPKVTTAYFVTSCEGIKVTTARVLDDVSVASSGRAQSFGG